MVYVEVQLMTGLTPNIEYTSGPPAREGRRAAAARAIRGPAKLVMPASAPARKISRRFRADNFVLFDFMTETPYADQLPKGPSATRPKNTRHDNTGQLF